HLRWLGESGCFGQVGGWDGGLLPVEVPHDCEVGGVVSVLGLAQFGDQVEDPLDCCFAAGLCFCFGGDGSCEPGDAVRELFVEGWLGHGCLSAWCVATVDGAVWVASVSSRVLVSPACSASRMICCSLTPWPRSRL